MKKPVLLLLGIAIGVGVSYFYFNRQEATTTSEEATMARAIVKPKGVITPAQARTLNNRVLFKTTKYFRNRLFYLLFLFSASVFSFLGLHNGLF